MAKQNDSSPEAAVTEHVPAPATTAPRRYIMPNEMEVERVGNLSSGVTQVFPEVRGGICEWCGVVDGNYPSHYQYKLCPHYRGMQLQCSYCPGSKDADDVINHSTLRILKHPTENKLLIHCDSYECLKKHEQRWKVSN